MTKTNDKIKVLYLGDYTSNTGFGVVSRNIWKNLYATGHYDLDVMGINYHGEPYDRDEWPGKVWPAISAMNAGGKYNDVYGRQKLLDMLGAGEYDILFILQDTFIVTSMMEAIIETQLRHHHPFKTVLYFPIDSTPAPEWITECVSKIDYPVAYTQYGYDECIKIDPSLAKKLRIIYHGHDPNDFYPIEDVREFRHAAFRGETDSRFLITNVNRNQRRKDIARNFQVLKELYRRGRKEAILYLHSYWNDVGGNLISQAENFGFEMNRDFLLPMDFNVQTGFPVSILNSIYNASDCIFTTTLGEGWGLSVTEAFGTKIPVVCPDNTSLSEIGAEGRAHLVKSGTNPSLWIIKDQDNDRLRPLTDVEDAADKIEMVMDGKLPDIEGAYQWALNNNWTEIAKKWDSLLLEAVAAPTTRPLPKRPAMAVPKGKRR